MNYQRQPQLRPLPTRGALRSGRDQIEWEDMPSLQQHVRRHSDFGPSQPPVWNATAPMGLWQPPPPSQFSEVLNGLHVREIHGREVFDHFFGSQSLPR